MLSVLVPKTIVWIFVALETLPENSMIFNLAEHVMFSAIMKSYIAFSYIWSHWLNYFKNNSGLRNDLLNWEMSYSNEVHMNH